MDRWMAGQKMPPASDLSKTSLDLYFDPTVNKIYRATVTGDIARAMAKMQSILSMRLMGPALNQRVRQQLNAQLGNFVSQLPDEMIPPLEGILPTAPFIPTIEQSIGPDSYAQLPSAAQQNVPAWSLFGMFFIVVPLSNILIVERREGILARLMTMPVSMASLVLGKLTAYVMVCLVQFLCIAMVGRWLLPLLGTDPLILDRQQPAIFITAVISALAATGYGIMLGALSRTNQQANVLGPLSIVIAAALGGIMVPVFAMPPAMQLISHISPLAWAHDAFMVLMVRGGTLVDAWWQLTLLVLFFLTAFAVALLSLRRY
jgi:ABC-2 type transport system permease protein